MNTSLFYFLNNLAFQNEFFDTLVIFIADWLIWWLIFITIALFILKKISFKTISQIFIITLIAWLVAELIKHFYFSPRPFLVLTEVKLLFTHGLNDSFPSGHITLTFALATAISLFTNYKIGLLFFTGAFLIGLSRIIIGIHWPLDILAGALLGTIIVLIFHLFKTKLK